MRVEQHLRGGRSNLAFAAAWIHRRVVVERFAGRPAQHIDVVERNEPRAGARRRLDQVAHVPRHKVGPDLRVVRRIHAVVYRRRPFRCLDAERYVCSVAEHGVRAVRYAAGGSLDHADVMLLVEQNPSQRRSDLPRAEDHGPFDHA
jgi:hypothetical protein